MINRIYDLKNITYGPDIIGIAPASRFDADDVIQETYYAAYVGFSKLQNTELFKPWIFLVYYVQTTFPFYNLTVSCTFF